MLTLVSFGLRVVGDERESRDGRERERIDFYIIFLNTKRLLSPYISHSRILIFHIIFLTEKPQSCIELNQCYRII